MLQWPSTRVEAADAAEARRDGKVKAVGEQDREGGDRAAPREPRPRERRGVGARQEHRPAYGSMRSRPENGPKTAPIGPARRPAGGRRPGPHAGGAHPSRVRDGSWLGVLPATVDHRRRRLRRRGARRSAWRAASRRWPAARGVAGGGMERRARCAVAAVAAAAARRRRASRGSGRWRGCRGSARSSPALACVVAARAGVAAGARAQPGRSAARRLAGRRPRLRPLRRRLRLGADDPARRRRAALPRDRREPAP